MPNCRKASSLVEKVSRSETACDGEDDDDEDDDDEDDDHEDDDDEDRRRGPTTLMIGVGGQINITSCRQLHILATQCFGFVEMMSSYKRHMQFGMHLALHCFVLHCNLECTLWFEHLHKNMSYYKR